MTTRSFYQCLEPGLVQQIGSHTFERDEILEFAAEFDPQRFHMDDEAAAQSNFGKLCASGWHTISVWMGLNVRNGNQGLIALSGYTGPPPVMGPSPGVRNIKWMAPVYVGDTITYRSTLTGKRTSPNRKGWGMLMNRTEGFNQNGVQVLSMDGAVTLRVD